MVNYFGCSFLNARSLNPSDFRFIKFQGIKYEFETLGIGNFPSGFSVNELILLYILKENFI